MAPKSTFVTVLAWLFIVGAGFFSLVSVMQVIMFTMMFSGDELNSAPDDAQFIPVFFQVFLYGFLALALFTLVSAIALLKRKNWARIAFIVILSIGILWQVGGLLVQYLMFSGVSVVPNEEGFEDFERMGQVFLWIGVIIEVFVSGLFAWIVRKLMSSQVIAEFVECSSNEEDLDVPNVSVEKLED